MINSSASNSRTARSMSRARSIPTIPGNIVIFRYLIPRGVSSNWQLQFDERTVLLFDTGIEFGPSRACHCAAQYLRGPPRPTQILASWVGSILPRPQRSAECRRVGHRPNHQTKPVGAGHETRDLVFLCMGVQHAATGRRRRKPALGTPHANHRDIAHRTRRLMLSAS